jgi:carbon-monoxide dehydrogenase medium subunit
LLVDIGRIEGLSYIREDGDWLKIGAMTTETELEQSDLVRAHYPLLNDASSSIADPIVRNKATLGGNLAHADPANDHPGAMLAYNAQIVAAGPSGERVIPIGDFFVSLFETALTRDEILTEIRIPRWKAGDGGAYVKVERKVGDYSTAAVAVQLSLDANGVIRAAGIGLTNVGATPIRAAAAEAAVRNKPATDDTFRPAALLASDAAEPSDDLRGSAEYKRSLVKTLTLRALRRATTRAKGM